ncbi:MAG: low temperature requirement protein A [Streptosporangiaceae bacterium]|jgi:low temperature requirement protein LtrA|nr:hypothetical protein [Actinomycetota bacterium]
MVTQARQWNLMRDRSGGEQRVTNIELFFDLVYVFAVTQLSHFLLHHRTVTGALQAALLMVMVWLLWVYTTWVTNWLDPERLGVRLLLLALMLVSLVMAAALPEAFDGEGLAVGCCYALMQIGRSAFTVVALPGETLQRNFERILAWCCASGALAVAGGLSSGDARWILWLAAVATDLLGGIVGFYTPGLGRSSSGDWDIAGGHFAERCQAFILIALGESIVIIGATFAGLLATGHGGSAAEIAAFAVAFAGSAGLWWLYFDRSAEDGARRIAASADPGRLGRSAYHFIHPVMVAGIIVVAAADQIVLQGPAARGVATTSWMILGGTGLYIAGHTAFKAVVFRRTSVPRLIALAVLALLGILAPHVTALTLGICAAAVILTVAATDRLHGRGDDSAPAAGAPDRVNAGQ